MERWYVDLEDYWKGNGYYLVGKFYDVQWVQECRYDSIFSNFNGSVLTLAIL